MKTTNHIVRLAAIAACLLTAIGAWAADSLRVVRPVTSAYMVEGGSSHLADTYLTPLRYTGERLALSYERTQAMAFSPEEWLMQLGILLGFDLTKNPVRNATMAAASVDAGWRMLRRWQLPGRVQVGVGPGVSLSAGALYLSRNGNNPASAKAAFTFDAAAYAAWSSKVWRVPFTLRYQALLPVAGVFFSPNYAQLYYQIYLGDTKGLCHPAWWGSYFSLDNLVTADLHFGATTLRLGYRGRIFSSKANNLVSREIDHGLVLGIVTDWISLRRGQSLPAARVVQAY